ncbi:MAG: Mth938-like domain-containing protein [Gammaproteobacteria bacterium]
MQFSEDKPTQPFVFRRVDEHTALVNETHYDHSIIITVEPALLNWPITAIEQLTAELLAPLMQGHPDLILLGTGAKSSPLPHALLALCWEKRIGLEVMTTPAAARTYNLLANEGRRVAIGIILY